MYTPQPGLPPSGSLDHLALLQPLQASLQELAASLLSARLDAASSAPAAPFDPEPYLDAAAPLFAALKRINRAGNGMVNDQKHKVAEARAEVDGANLVLQNLVYERRHLEREIAECRAFDTAYQNINLHPLDELAAAKAAAGEMLPDDPHELMLVRLRFELTERKRHEGEKKELLQSKLKLSKENDEKKTQLDDLEKQLDGFVTVAKEIQAKMAAQS